MFKSSSEGSILSADSMPLTWVHFFAGDSCKNVFAAGGGTGCAPFLRGAINFNHEWSGIERFFFAF